MVVLETIVWVLFVYIFDIHKRRRLSRKCWWCIWYAQLIGLIECAVKHKWASHMILLSMLRLQFGWSHSAKFWLGYLGYNGTYQNCRYFLLVTITIGRAVFVLTKCYAGGFKPMNRCSSLHLYLFLDLYWATWLYLFSSYTYGVLLLEQFFVSRVPIGSPISFYDFWEFSVPEIFVNQNRLNEVC